MGGVECKQKRGRKGKDWETEKYGKQNEREAGKKDTKAEWEKREIITKKTTGKAKKQKKLKQSTSGVQQNNTWPKYDNEINQKEKCADEMLSTSSHTVIIHELRSVIQIMEYWLTSCWSGISYTILLLFMSFFYALSCPIFGV